MPMSGCQRGRLVRPLGRTGSWSTGQVYAREGSARQNGVGTARAESWRRRHIEYCVLNYGCWHSAYPWSQINAFYGGNWTCSWGGI
jgi:hypothetical protein